MILLMSRKRCYQGKTYISSGRKRKMVIKIEFTLLPDCNILPLFRVLKNNTVWLNSPYYFKFVYRKHRATGYGIIVLDMISSTITYPLSCNILQLK